MQNKNRENVALSFAEYLGIRLYNYSADLLHRLGQRIKPQKAPEDAIELGTGIHPHHSKRRILRHINPEQRAKHIYVIGATGSGKTKLLESLARQDIQKGNGFGIIDCHGDLTSDIINYLSTLPPYSKISRDEYESFIYEKVVLVDPTNKEFSVSVNPLQITAGVRPYAQALELLEVFKKIWGYWGPRMDELMRNALVTLAESGLTLLEVQPLLTDDAFRMNLVRGLKNADARSYWLERFDPLSQAMRSQYAEPVLNKTQKFVADPAIRAIIGQRKSTIDFREIMDEGKILLVNLAKGALKENAMLLGALLVAKIQMSAMSRADIPKEQRRPWYLFVDEFQNFATESFSEILSESRKYGLSLVMAHQNLDQLNDMLRASILANVSTQVFFALSKNDAMKLASEISISGRRNIVSILTQQKTREAYLRMRGEMPMAIKSPFIPETKYDPEKVDLVRQGAIRAYCRRNDESEDTAPPDTQIFPFEPTGGIQNGTKPKFAPEGAFQEGK